MCLDFGFQSETTAAKIATSKLKSDRTVSSISWPVSTFRIVAPRSISEATGPVTNTTSAPALSKASAIAFPCFPEDRFEMKRTGSIGLGLDQKLLIPFYHARFSSRLV